jgi:hypothetical protein
MSNTDIIIFSKHRTLQLRSLLKSIGHYSDISEDEITVLYVESEDIPYNDLRSEFQCRFVPQGSFLHDLRKIVDESSADYVCWMVDDLIFKDSFSMRAVESILDRNPDIDCFSLRLGRNIKDGTPPEFSMREDGVLVWETRRRPTKAWDKFWEVSGSIYRKELVSEYLRKCNPENVSYPNPLESHYSVRMPSRFRPKSRWKKLLLDIRFLASDNSHRMGCFEWSKCFTQGVNLVAEREIDYQTMASPQELHQKMKDGFIIDYRSIHGVENVWPNAGRKYFRLVNDQD